MQIRFREHIRQMPVIEIMPNFGKFDSLDAYIQVSFFDYLENKKFFRPLVRANVNFGNRMNPEDSYYWSECFKSAYEIAIMRFPENINLEQKEIISELWIRVNEIKSFVESV